MAEEPPQTSSAPPAGPAMTTASLTLPHLLHPTTLQDTVRAWLREDTPSFDYGGYVVGEKEETAVLLCKSAGVIAGRPFFEAVFSELGCTVEWLVEEGAWLEPVTRAAYVRGSVRHILLGERVALNCMARISGVATVCRALRELADKSRWTGQVAGTRKTTPGFRIAEKYGLLVGGVSTHRYDLSAMIMLKDNHIWSAGNITKAVQAAQRVAGFSTKVEVECGSVEEANEAASAGADIVMLDNFTSQGLHIAARKVKAAHPHVMVEASGGITRTTLPEYFGPDIDIISMSATTQGYGVVDFSLKILKEGNTISTKGTS